MPFPLNVGRGGDGGGRVLSAAQSVSLVLSGAHNLGATTLAVDSVEGVRVGMGIWKWHARSSVTTSQITAVDEDANEIAIQPGLTAALADTIGVEAVALVGDGAELALPDAGDEVVFEAAWDLWNIAAANAPRVIDAGMGTGWYSRGHAFARAHVASGAWSYWQDHDSPYVVMSMPDRLDQDRNFFELRYDPSAGVLQMLGRAGGAHTLVPVLTMLRVSR